MLQVRVIEVATYELDWNTDSEWSRQKKNDYLQVGVNRRAAVDIGCGSGVVRYEPCVPHWLSLILIMCI